MGVWKVFDLLKDSFFYSVIISLKISFIPRRTWFSPSYSNTANREAYESELEEDGDNDEEASEEEDDSEEDEEGDLDDQARKQIIVYFIIVAISKLAFDWLNTRVQPITGELATCITFDIMTSFVSIP